MTTPTEGCPFRPRTLPGDGTPLTPSPSLATWREEGAATPLQFDDGHDGLVVTRYDLARSVLEDPRFTMRSGRLPRGPEGSHDAPQHGTTGSETTPAPLDAAARRSERAGLLGLDGEDHARLRRSVTSRFSVRQVRGRVGQVEEIVAAQLAEFRAAGAPGDVWRGFAQPVAARVHCLVLGVPDGGFDRFVELFVDGGTQQEKYDFIRWVLSSREGDPGEDVVTDLLASDVVSREEAEGLLHMLMSSGRDSVAYLVTTATVALLTHPEQLQVLLDDPARIAPAVEEFMRTGAMFLTLFPRTTLEDVELDGVAIPAGTTVSVSSVAANRDPRRWEEPDRFDVGRDAFGHLGFGHGIHGCIGQQLARLEIRESVTRLLAELPGLRLVEAEQLRPLPFANPVATYEAGRAVLAWD